MMYEPPYKLPSIPRQHTLIGAGGFIESQDFVSGPDGSGWRIDGSGNFEGNDGNFRGDITGASGTFSSSLSVGTGNDIFRVDTDGDMWIGHATQGSAPFQITKAGVLTATSGTFSGSLSVTSGTIGGWTVASSSLSLSGTGTTNGLPGTMTLKRSGISCGLWVSTANSVADGYIIVNEGEDAGDGIHSNLQMLAPKMASDGHGRPGMTIKNYVDGDSFVDIGLDDSDPNIRLSDYGGTDKISFTGLVRYVDNGSVSAPTVNFLNNDADSGFYYSAATQIGLASDGHDAMISTSGTGSSGSAAGTIATAAFDTNSTSGYQAVYRNNTYGTLARYTSNRADKDNIQSFSNSGAIIDALQPVTFVTKARDGESTADKAWREADIQHGFIAEDVADVADGKFASYDNVDGSLVPNGWRQPDMISLIVAELKSIRQRLAALES